MRMSRIPALAALGVAGAVTLAACGSSGGSNPTSTPPNSPSSTQSTQATQSTLSGGGGNTLTATETEFHIALGSSALKAGTYSIDVKNAGKITHALTVDGPGVSDMSTGDLQPGASKTLTVTLKAGKYEIYCPVGDHKMEGMDETVQVS